jgi:hypothetical protein
MELFLLNLFYMSETKEALAWNIWKFKHAVRSLGFSIKPTKSYELLEDHQLMSIFFVIDGFQSIRMM